MIDYSKPPDYSGYTVEQLQAAFVQAGADLVAISNVRLSLFELMNRRKAEAAAMANVANLNPAERDALRAALQ